MSALGPPELASDHFSSVLEWLENSDASADLLKLNFAQDTKGIASSLYGRCVLCMHHICRNRRPTLSSEKSWLMLREEMDAFVLWGHAFGSEELDQALSLLDDLRTSVLESLVEIGKILQRVYQEIAPPNFESWTIYQDLNKAIDVVQEEITHTEQCLSDLISLTDTHNHPPSSTGIEELTKELQPPVRYLINISPSLHENLEVAALERPLQAPSALLIYLDIHERAYATCIIEKFPKANEAVVCRLARANWRRHFEVRQQELKADLMPASSSVISVPPSLQLNDSRIDASIWSNSETNAFSHFLESCKSIRDQTNFRVPEVPDKGASGGVFQCSLCHKVVSGMDSPTRWREHFFEDIRPYMCTFDNCDQENVQYTTIEAWEDHELSEHIDREDFTYRDGTKGPQSGLEAPQHIHVGPDGVRSPLLPKSLRCNLCLENNLNNKASYVVHVSKHLEDIALMACPPGKKEDSPHDARALTPPMGVNALEPFLGSPSPYLASPYYALPYLQSSPSCTDVTGSLLSYRGASTSSSSYRGASTTSSSYTGASGSSSSYTGASGSSGGGPAQYHCLAEGCNYISTRAYNVKRHMNIHNPTRTFPCDYSWCGRDERDPFLREDHLNEHLRKVHLKDKGSGKRKGGTQDEEHVDTPASGN